MHRRGFIGLPVILTAVFLILLASGGVYYYKSKKKQEPKQEQQPEANLSEEKVATPSPSLTSQFSPLPQPETSPTSIPSPEPEMFELDFDGKIYLCPENKANIINPLLEEYRKLESEYVSRLSENNQCKENQEKCVEACVKECGINQTPTQSGKCYDGTCLNNCLASFKCEGPSSEMPPVMEKAKLQKEVKEYCQ